MIKKEKTLYDEKMLEQKNDFNPIVAEVERVKALRVQAMGIKDLANVDKTDRELMVKETPATQIIKQEVQGALKTDRQLKKEHEFLG